MTIRKFSVGLVLLSIVLGFQQCSKSSDATTTTTTTGGGGGTTGGTTLQPNLPATPYNYVMTYPAHIQNALIQNDNTPADNPLTNDGATLGRVLFYDKNLSKNNSVSCGSCHRPDQSFSDSAVFSTGFAGALTARHSMTTLNVRFYKSGKMFWDERAASVEKQALVPIQSSVEMGLTLAELESRVKSLSYYPALFQKAFGSTQIDSIRIAKAIAQFERAMVTYQSKYDRVKQGIETFTTAEATGEQLFNTPPPPPPGGGPNPPSCAGCHTPPMFITSTPAGPFTIPDANDKGINNEGRFKSGTLRNMTLRKSLFHNGSTTNVFAMLSGGPVGSPTHVPAHSVAPQDVQNLLAFMQTLNDNSIITDVKFSDPFK